jgi:rRNA-processing protein FCF1
MIFEFSVDLEAELTRLLGRHKAVIPKSVFDELRFLSQQQDGRRRQIAKAAMQFIKKFEIVNTKIENADDAIFNLAKETDWVVVTNDKELRKRLRNILLPVIFLRGKKTLMLEGSVN